jgi:hypothetical protein
METVQPVIGSSEQNPYVFVVGCPRSGTTLLQRMLDAHPALAVPNDTHFIPKAVKAVAPHAMADVIVGAPLALNPDLVEAARTYHRFSRMELSEASVERAAAAQTYRDFVTALYSEHARLKGKPLAGDKTPDYARYLPFLHGLFPRARFIHIIRDGRDVALSGLEWAKMGKGPGRRALWREEPVAVCALWWRWQVTTGRTDGAALGRRRYHEIRYESLVARPEETLRSVAEFLDLPFDARMVAFHEGKSRSEPGLSAKKAWLPATPGLRDWRAQMAPRDVELFEAVAGDLLSELGYDRACPAISPQVAVVADRCQTWWEEDQARRKAKEADRVARFTAPATSI